MVCLILFLWLNQVLEFMVTLWSLGFQFRTTKNNCCMSSLSKNITRETKQYRAEGTRHNDIEPLTRTRQTRCALNARQPAVSKSSITQLQTVRRVKPIRQCC